MMSLISAERNVQKFISITCGSGMKGIREGARGNDRQGN